MSEHVCEDNIEDSYENFDIIESEIKRMPIPRRSIDLNFNQREEKSPADFFDEKMFVHQNKVALNSDVDLIKTSRLVLPKPEVSAEDDKVSGEKSLETSRNSVANFFSLSLTSCPSSWYFLPRKYRFWT